MFEATVQPGVLPCDEARHIVTLSGELDLVSCKAATADCTEHLCVDVVVDLAKVTFMDCAGYRALVAANTILEARGGSLLLTGAVGEPLRLLSIIEQGAHVADGSSFRFTSVDGHWAVE